MKTKTKLAKTPVKGELGEMFEKYGALLERMASYIHSRVGRGIDYTTTKEVARWIALDLPTTYKEFFGRQRMEPKLKVWRVLTLISNARFLGAFDSLDVKSVRGRGLTAVEKPRKAKFRLIQGGRG